MDTSLQSSGQILYLASNSTSASFPATTAGRKTTPSGSTLFSLGPGYGVRHRGVEMTPFGAGSANQTFDYKVWVVKRGYASLNGAASDISQQLFCSGTVTLGATAGVATSGGPKSTDLIGDTITVTLSAYGTAVVAAYNGLSPSVFSPADDTEARLFIPELGDASDIFIEFDMTGATSGNFMVERVV